jgi:hypothetical protein
MMGNMILHALRRAGIGSHYLSAKLSKDSRETLRKDFHDDPNLKVLVG